ncbi:MAG TPA: response regulator transcription factor [Casimicrobiaceae bacterium]|nr:response regulator transcription factor [Casimicrobiaceae bacterium]
MQRRGVARMIRIVLADDHAVVRDGLRVLLQAQPDFEVVGDAANGREAMRLTQQLHPDVVVMDIAMPELNGIEATLQIHDVAPATQVLILSMHSTTEHIFRALQAGARGYLLKDSAGAEVVDAVRVVHAGRRYLSPKIASTVIDDYISERQRASPLDSLSRRERQILQLVAEGKSSAEAAAMLFLSPKTVDTYRSRMMQKLGIADVPSLVKFAIQHGVTQLD